MQRPEECSSTAWAGFARKVGTGSTILVIRMVGSGMARMVADNFRAAQARCWWKGWVEEWDLEGEEG